jgi:hypothetical protein
MYLGYRDFSAFGCVVLQTWTDMAWNDATKDRENVAIYVKI